MSLSENSRYVFNNVFGVIILSSKNRFLLLRGRAAGKWSFPKGHRELRESSYECAMRELREETSLSLTGLKPTVGPIKLAAGSYYLFRPKHEMEPVICDKKEVIDARWFTFNEIKQLPRNIDINRFIEIVSRPENSYVRNQLCGDEPPAKNMFTNCEIELPYFH